MSKKLIQVLVLGAVSALVASACWKAGWLEQAESLLWAKRVSFFARKSASTDKIKIILLDQYSLDWAAKDLSLSWPWPRQVYAPLIDFCARGGAKTIAFDVLFTEDSSYGVEDDAMMGDAVARAGNFVAAVFLGKQTRQTENWPEQVKRSSLSIDGLQAWSAAMPQESRLEEPAAAFPVDAIATNATVLASVKETPDFDGIFRRAAPFRVFDGTVLPSLGAAAYFMDNNSPLRIERGWLHAGERKFPLDKGGRILLRFRGKSGTHQTITAASILNAEAQAQEGKTPDLDPGIFKDCHVFFGFSAPGLKDLRPTPVGGDYPGVEIHATLLDNLLEMDALRDAPKGPVAAVLVLLALLAAWSVVMSGKASQTVTAFIVILPIPVVLGFAGYAAGYWWPIVPAELAVLLGLTSAVVWNYATEGRQKRFIKSAFNQYVGEEVLDEMTRDPSKLRLGGEKKEITMFFSDLEKFSSFSERLDPPRLIELLNVYLTEMGQVIKQETAGYLDKFVGDAIVAFWNGPVVQPDHAARAVRAAILCQRRLAEKRDEWAAQFNAVLKMRIGIGTGEVVVGNMGSKDKFNYTMLGDAANAASRLEGANKAFGTFTMVSEVTWAQARSQVVGREIGAIRVVGRKTPVKVYEPMGLAGEALPGWVADFEQGLALCREGKWAEALAIMEKITNDPCSQVYAKRCRDLVDGTLAGWDGVWNLTEK